MRKKVIKAHKGYMHVSKPSGQQQAPSKAKGTAGTTPRTPKRRMIGLPQQFRSSRRRMPTAAAPQDAPPMVRPTQTMPEPKRVKPVNEFDERLKKTGNPFKKGSHNYEVYAGRGGRPSLPVTELPNKDRKIIQRPKPQSFRVPAVQVPKSIPKPMQPRIMKQGGYVSRANYGIVDNLKGK